MFGLFKKNLATSVSPELDAALLVPRIWHKRFVQGYSPLLGDLQQNGRGPDGTVPVFRPLVGDLVVSYAFNLPNQFVTVTHQHVQVLGMSFEELHSRATDNLFALVRNRVAFKKLALTPPADRNEKIEVPMFHLP